MERHFYPERGKAAWPSGCPSCGEPVTLFEPGAVGETGEYAAWTFGCGCVILEDCDVYDACPDAMSRHMEGIIIHDEDAA
jgi:hypothetical protein